MSKNYQGLLKNLLDIKVKDPCLFTKLKLYRRIDIVKKFDSSIIKKCLTDSEIEFKIKEINLDKLINQIHLETNFIAIKLLCEKYNFKLTKLEELMLKSEDSRTVIQYKNKIIEKIKSQKNKIIKKWQIFRHVVNEDNEITNIWPLHLATCFIAIQLSSKAIYAPLLLKEMYFFHDKNSLELSLRSKGEWKLNEKLLFYLDQEGIVFKEKINLTDFKDLNSIQAINLVVKNLGIKKQSPTDISVLFRNLKSDQIVNKDIRFFGGLILGLFKPSGGFLKKQLKTILDKGDDELENIIIPEINKLNYQKKINESIENNEIPILKIQASNFSQDRATISSLKQNTIIWGPPGTGKSQTIANIIANIIYKNKTALVLSQKRAALDVLRERLNSINIFAFFLINNAEQLEDFYKPLKKLVAAIENFDYSIKNTQKNNWILSTELKTYIHQIKYLKKANQDKKILFLENLQLVKYLKFSNLEKNKQIEIFKLILTLPENFKFIQLSKIKNNEKAINLLASINNIKKYKKIFSWKFKNKDKLFLENILKTLTKISQIDVNINLNLYPNIINYKNSQIFEYLLNLSADDIELKSKFKTDEPFLRYSILENIRNKYHNWRKNNLNKYKKFYHFCNVIRAGAWLPYKFLANFYDIILEICPIIITTPQLINFKLSKELFDYALLDESSQLFVEVGIPILYSAKIKVLAGDPQQMKPTNWFNTRFLDENNSVIDERDIAVDTNSLLDYGINKGMFQIMLDKNYRAQSAALMSFSAKQFYNSKLDVLDQLDTKIENPVEIINVNGTREDYVNKKEAQKTIELTIKYLNVFSKIIILAFNLAQKNYIQKLIFEEHDILVKAIEDKKLMLRNIENIQGDEADLIIMSVTYDPGTWMSQTYVCRNGGSNALNVALSRARKKMIILKSVNDKNIKRSQSSDFKIFHNWLKFLRLSKENQKKYSSTENQEHKIIISKENDVESNFEQNVLDTLKKEIIANTDLILKKQFNVGSKRIDIAVLNSNQKFLLGIEVDGYRWHEGQGYQKILEDQSRQNYIEAKGYLIYRIKEYPWRINKEKIISEINLLIQNS